MWEISQKLWQATGVKANVCYLDRYNPLTTSTLTTLTILSDGLGRVVECGTVLGIDVDLLWVVVTWLELRHVFHAVDQVPRSLRDTADTRRKQLLRGSFLNERVAAADWTRNGRRRVHCAQNSDQVTDRLKTSAKPVVKVSGVSEGPRPPRFRYGPPYLKTRSRCFERGPPVIRCWTGQWATSEVRTVLVSSFVMWYDHNQAG